MNCERNSGGENAQLIGAMVTKKIELQSLWSNPKADDKAIQDKAKEVRDLQNQMKEKAVQMRLEARKILTPEQISKWGAGRGFGHGHLDPAAAVDMDLAGDVAVVSVLSINNLLPLPPQKEGKGSITFPFYFHPSGLSKP